MVAGRRAAGESSGGMCLLGLAWLVICGWVDVLRVPMNCIYIVAMDKRMTTYPFM